MREHEFKPFEKVLVRDTDNDAWSLSLFSNKQERGFPPYVCINGVGWAQCIPFEGNEHLLGTTDSPTPPEPEFRFGDKVEVRDSIEEPWRRGIFKSRQNHKHLPFRVITEDWNDLAGWKYCRHADW